MGIFREIPPTAGFPLYLRDFLSVLKQGSLEEDLKGYLGLDYVKVTYSGTAAFYLILEALKSLSSETTVILPSYICPLIPLATKRAGLNVEVCDIERDSFNYNLRDLERLCSNKNDILAVVAVHLSGIPVDFNRLETVVKSRGIFIIEDCAQSLGAEYRGKKSGTMGDFSFFSFCRGKGLTLYEGGALAANKKEHAEIIDKKINLLVKNAFFSEGLKMLELFGYWIFYRPFLFWFVFNLPHIFWALLGNKMRAAAEYFTVGFPIHKISRFRTSIGHATFERLEQEIAKQREKAHFYLDSLKEVKGIRVIEEPRDAKATYPYLTLIFDEPRIRNKAWSLFKNSGLGVSQLYAYAITDYDYLKQIIPQGNFPNAHYLAEREITLSTSTFLRKKDIDSVINTIKKL